MISAKMNHSSCVANKNIFVFYANKEEKGIEKLDLEHKQEWV